MTLPRPVQLLLSSLIAGMLPTITIAHVTSTGLGVLEVTGRDLSYRLTEHACCPC